jgi:hypothetical protein
MNLRKVTLRYLGWCPGIESAARFVPDREISGTRASAGALFDIGTIIWTSLIAISLIRYSRGGPSSMYPYYYMFWLGVLIELDAKLLYLMSYPPEFFDRANFRPERLAMMTGGIVYGAGLLYYLFFRQVADPAFDFLLPLFAILPVFPYRVKFEKTLKEHSERDALLDGFYGSSLIGRALLKMGLGPVMRRAFI